jgi:hypothetical protein
MTQVNDELALREALAEMTVGQPAAPPDRYTAVRRRAVLQRRRRLAGIAAAVGVLAAAAVTIPLGLHAAAPAPQAPQRHYRVSEEPPRPGAKGGLVATGVVSGYRWNMIVSLQQDELCWGSDFHTAAGLSTSCAGPPSLALAGNGGAPLFLFGGVGTTPQVDVGTVRSDVAYLRVSYGNGQVLTAYPVAVFASRYARYVAIPAPYSAAVTLIAAHSRTGELAYAVPYTGGGSISTVRWLRPGQPALPRPVTATIGSGTAQGVAWHEDIYVGPWGTCFGGAGGGGDCRASTGWMPYRGHVAGQLGLSVGGRNIYFFYGQAETAVTRLTVTTTHGHDSAVPLVTVDGRRFFALASVPSDRAVRWTAYRTGGVRLASGSFTS